jgi:hypothetical protein
LEDAGWGMLEQFAKVTVFAKDKTTQALEHPLARPILPLIPENVRSHFLSSAEAEALLQDYDSAQHYLAHLAQEWQHKLKQTADKFMDSDEIRADTRFDFENVEKMYTSHFVGLPLTKETWNSMMEKKEVDPHEVSCHIFCGVEVVHVGH